MSDLRVVGIEEEHECADAIGGCGGWVGEGDTFDGFAEDYDDDVQPHLQALRRWVVDNKWREAIENRCIVFSDGKCWSASWRCSGDLLASIWNSEGEEHNYMHFYMRDK